MTAVPPATVPPATVPQQVRSSGHGCSVHVVPAAPLLQTLQAGSWTRVVCLPISRHHCVGGRRTDVVIKHAVHNRLRSELTMQVVRAMGQQQHHHRRTS